MVGRGHLELTRSLDIQFGDNAVLDEDREALGAHAHAEARAVHFQTDGLGKLAIAVRQHDNLVAGILGLGAVISSTGLGEAVVAGLSGHADFSVDRPVWNVVMLTGISTVVAMITNLPGVPAVMTPMAEKLAVLTGLPLTTVLMTQVLAFSNVFLPYQAPPLIMAMQLGNLPAGAVARLCLALFVIGLVVLLPLDLVWWHVLGLV